MLFVLHKKVGAEHRPDIMILQKRQQKHGTEGKVNKMSYDLISRRTIKSLVETIRDCWAISPYVSANDMKLYSKVFNVVLNEISNCPTAFDKEKVIEELNSERNLMYREDGTLMGARTQISIDRAVDIVEKGGIE